MNIATGYCFSSKDIMANLDLSKLALTRANSIKYFNQRNRRIVAIRVFLFCIKTILLDIINNNVTFMLPTKRECYIYMKKTSGEDFKQARRNGKWLDVDYLMSNFSGYQMEFVYIASERMITKPIYVNKELRDIITENTNKGKQYYYSVPKHINDYYNIVSEKFPKIPLKDIERILKFAWNSVYLHNVYGGDVLLLDRITNKFIFYIGKLTYDSLKHFKYYVKKMIVKIRVYYNRSKVPWDGYYYFGLREDQYQNYLSQIKSVGRKRKHFTFDGTIMLYKIYDECKVTQFNCKYFFKIPTGVDLGYKYLKYGFKTDKAEYIETLEANGFKTLKR